jgi:hypothetical protein
MVHYVVPAGPGEGQHRPAVIVKVWDQETGLVNLDVFTDGGNDDFLPWAERRDPVLWVTSVSYSEEPVLRSWHWIEKA